MSDIIIIDVSSLCHAFPHLIKFTSNFSMTTTSGFTVTNNNNTFKYSTFSTNNNDTHISNDNKSKLILRPQYPLTTLFAPENENLINNNNNHQHKIIFDSNVFLLILRTPSTTSLLEEGKNKHNEKSEMFYNKYQLIHLINYITDNFQQHSLFWREYQDLLKNIRNSGDDLKLQEWRLHITKGPLLIKKSSSSSTINFQVELILIPNDWSFDTVRWYYYYQVNRPIEYLNSKVGMDLLKLQEDSKSFITSIASFSFFQKFDEKFENYNDYNYIVHLDITEFASLINNSHNNSASSVSSLLIPYTFTFGLKCDKTSSKNKLYDIICIYLLNHKGFEKMFDLYLTIKAITSLSSYNSCSPYLWSFKNLFLSDLRINYNSNSKNNYNFVYAKIVLSHENRLSFVKY